MPVEIFADKYLSRLLSLGTESVLIDLTDQLI